MKKPSRVERDLTSHARFSRIEPYMYLLPFLIGILAFTLYPVINVIFRILAKGYANRVTLLADRVTHPNQTAFIKGRYILDGVLVLHEVLHEVRTKNLKAVFLKIDFH